jgi:hypothetical protein
MDYYEWGNRRKYPLDPNKTRNTSHNRVSPTFRSFCIFNLNSGLDCPDSCFSSSNATSYSLDVLSKIDDFLFIAPVENKEVADVAKSSSHFADGMLDVRRYRKLDGRDMEVSRLDEKDGRGLDLKLTRFGKVNCDCRSSGCLRAKRVAWPSSLIEG